MAQDIVFAILQGIAEIFPISPAAHTAVFESATPRPKPTLLFPMAVRGGVLVGIIAYFWRDIWTMVIGVARVLRGNRDPEARLAGQILLAAIPTVAFGLLVSDYINIDLLSPEIIGWAMTVGAILLFLFDHMSMTVKRVEHTTFLDAIIIGIAQVLILIPGTGRMILAITMARILGYERVSAARLSILIGIPVLLAFCIRDALELGLQTIKVTSADMLGSLIGMVSALIAVAILMAFLRRYSFKLFAIYRLFVGGIILAMAYGWVEI